MPPRLAPATEAPEVLPPLPSITEEEMRVIAEAKRTTLIDFTKAQLQGQPTRTVKVRAQGDVFVQINGFSYLIQPNVPVKVPEAVAVLLEEADYI